MLGVGTFALLVVGTSFIKYVPTIIVGGLIFHLGFDLMKEALIDTFKTVSTIEYVTIVLIVICMDIWGFTEGIIGTLKKKKKKKKKSINIIKYKRMYYYNITLQYIKTFNINSNYI